jgi:hypothetical protein
MQRTICQMRSVGVPPAHLDLKHNLLLYWQFIAGETLALQGRNRYRKSIFSNSDPDADFCPVPLKSQASLPASGAGLNIL